MAAFCSLAQAKQHLRVSMDTSDNDGDIALKLAQAQSLIVERCGTTAWWRVITTTWTSATVPGGVQSATLLVLGHLYENRGEDMRLDAALWEAVERLIILNKDPVLA